MSGDEENKSDMNGDDEKKHTPLHSFTLVADSFAHHCPGTVPAIIEDFSGIFILMYQGMT